MMSTSVPSAEADQPHSVEEKKKKKNISEILKDVQTYREELDHTEDFCSERCHTILKTISKFYWGYHKKRKDIGDKLAELRYPSK